jgi:hypothetical protein
MINSDLASRLGKGVINLLKIPAVKQLVMAGLASPSEKTKKSAEWAKEQVDIVFSS